MDEQMILGRMRQGDEAAFKTLYQRYSRTIYANIYKLIHDEEMADDLLQDVFIKIWEYREHIDPSQSFKAYLFTCSRHMVFNFKRRLRLEIEGAIQLAVRSEMEEQTVEAELYTQETTGLLNRAIEQLPAQRQRIFTLCKIDGHSYDEVASLLGITISTVRDHMVKAKKFLKAHMMLYGGITSSS